MSVGTETIVPAREYLMIVKEKALGVVMDDPVVGQDLIYIRLNDGNAFTPVAAPVIQPIMYGGGLAIQAEAVSDHYTVAGALKTVVYPTQAPFLMGWGCTWINAAQDQPWVTTENQMDLASCSLYHAIRRNDMTYYRKRYSGAKVRALKLDVSRGSTIAALNLDIAACRAHGYAGDPTSGPDPDESEFPPPTEDDYPYGPYTFAQTSGKMIFGVLRKDYEDLSISITNALDTRHFENYFCSINQFCGRASTCDTSLYFKNTPDDRSALETIQDQDASIEFDNGVNSMKLDFRGKNHIEALPFDLPLDKVYLQKMTIKNKWSPVHIEDLSFSFTGP